MWKTVLLLANSETKQITVTPEPAWHKPWTCYWVAVHWKWALTCCFEWCVRSRTVFVCSPPLLSAVCIMLLNFVNCASCPALRPTLKLDLKSCMCYTYGSTFSLDYDIWKKCQMGYILIEWKEGDIFIAFPILLLLENVSP